MAEAKVISLLDMNIIVLRTAILTDVMTFVCPVIAIENDRFIVVGANCDWPFIDDRWKYSCNSSAAANKNK